VLSGRASGAWVTVLEQDGAPYSVGEEPSGRVAVTSGPVPDAVRRWVERGGVLVVDGAAGGDEVVPPSSRVATVGGFESPETGDRVVAPGAAFLHDGSGSGSVSVHEDRVVKHGLKQGRYAAVHHRRLGAGLVVWSGLSLTLLLEAHGDRLRPVAPWSEVTERAATVDKAGVSETLAWMVRFATRSAGLPVVRRSAWPDGSASVFVLRVDVDGVFGDRARRLGAVAEERGVRATFLLNRELVERYPGDLGTWLDAHDVGQHAELHDLYDDADSDRRNLEAGHRWVEAITGRKPVGFVAPRGLWSPTLDAAISALGYRWSSDFGLATDGRPFRTRASVLQVPVHAYSPERAVLFAREQGRDAPTADEIRDHYLRHLEEQVRLGRPVHIYGHPEVLGAVAEEVLPAVFERVERLGLPKLTLDELATWWERRERAGLSATVVSTPDAPVLHLQRTDTAVGLEIELPRAHRVVLDGRDLGRHQGFASF
jgi:peptidoglycan/xylan/chitin deacetylase (PgdA/CDA1 family)